MPAKPEVINFTVLPDEKFKWQERHQANGAVRRHEVRVQKHSIVCWKHPCAICCTVVVLLAYAFSEQLFEWTKECVLEQ